MQPDIDQYKAYMYGCDNTVQIQHDGVNHWLLSSHITSTLIGYDISCSKAQKDRKN